MASKLDTPMNRAFAMVVKLTSTEMLQRARQLEEQYPESCWVSDVGSEKDIFHQHVLHHCFYYLLRGGKYWVNETWMQTGNGSPLTIQEEQAQ